MKKFKVNRDNKFNKEINMVLIVSAIFLLYLIFFSDLSLIPLLIFAILLLGLFLLKFNVNKKNVKKSLSEILINEFGIQQIDSDSNVLSLNWEEIDSVENKSIEEFIELRDASRKKRIKIFYDYTGFNDIVKTIIDNQIHKMVIKFPFLLKKNIKILVILEIILFLIFLGGAVISYYQNDDSMTPFTYWILVCIFFSIIFLIDYFTSMKYIRITQKGIVTKKGSKKIAVPFSKIKDIRFNTSYKDSTHFLELYLYTINNNKIDLVPDGRGKDILNIYKVIRLVIKKENIISLS